MYVLPDLSVREIILALEGDLTIFPAGAVLRLYVNNLTPTKTTVAADLTQLTNVEVPGYAAVPLAWNGTPARKQDGSWEDLGALASFVATGAPPAPQIVYGWYLTNALGTVLYGAGIFDVPFTFTQNGDGFILEPKINAVEATGTTYTLTLDMEVE